MGGGTNGNGGGAASAMDVYLPRTQGDVDDDGKERRTGTYSSLQDFNLLLLPPLADDDHRPCNGKDPFCFYHAW